MISTVSDLIKNKTEHLQKSIGSPGAENQNLAQQAAALVEQDQQNLPRLGTKFRIPNENELPAHLQSLDFDSFLAEQLLRESSLLLDRCLQQQREYQDLNTKWFETCVQVQELLWLSEIARQEEIENYDLPEQIAQSEQNAIATENAQIEVVLNQLNERFNFLTNDARVVELARAELAVTNQFAATPNISDEPLKVQVRLRSRREQIPLTIQHSQQMVVKNANAERVNGANLNVMLKHSLAKFQRERNEVARAVGIRRAMQLTTEGGALNFHEQMLPLKQRFENDLTACWLRIWGARRGFAQLYRYEDPTGNLPAQPYGVMIDFDELVTWCQNANTWLASFLNQHQQVTRSFGLTHLINRDGREIEQDGAVRSWQFRLNEEDFYNARFVRMRSFAVQIDSGNEVGSWNISLTPPRRAIMRHQTFDAQNPQLGRETIEQSRVGALFLGG